MACWNTACSEIRQQVGQVDVDCLHKPVHGTFWPQWAEIWQSLKTGQSIHGKEFLICLLRWQVMNAYVKVLPKIIHYGIFVWAWNYILPEPVTVPKNDTLLLHESIAVGLYRQSMESHQKSVASGGSNLVFQLVADHLQHVGEERQLLVMEQRVHGTRAIWLGPHRTHIDTWWFHFMHQWG